MEVTPHVILFLDILGYQNLISNCKPPKGENAYLKEVHALMDSLSKFIATRNQVLDEENDECLNLSRFKSMIFSDNILFFAPYNSEVDCYNLYANLLSGLAEFLFQYHKDDIFFRGAVTAGPLYYDDKLHFVFGSGLVQAYELESKKAKYPRIIMDKCLKPSSILYGWQEDPESGYFYLDYLSLAYAYCQHSDNLQLQERALKWLQNHQQSIQTALNKYKGDEKVYPKYFWLANYHNSFCQKSDLQDLRIDIVDDEEQGIN